MGGKWLNWFTLFLESKCPLCQRSTPQELCVDCRNQVQRCQLRDGEKFWREPLPVFAWGVYGGALKRTIAALKYENQPQLACPLGHWLAQAWLTVPKSKEKALTVIPIPMHASKQKQRGFNQAELIARSFCDVTGLPLQRDGLTRIRATEAQFNLSPTEREQNLTGAFELGHALLRRPPKGPILLLDDIYTTGATIRSAVSVLRQHQFPVHGVVAVAKAGAEPLDRN